MAIILYLCYFADFNPYLDIDVIDSLDFSVSAAVVPNIELQLYEGALEGILGVSLGPRVSTTIGFTKDEETCNILDSVDVDFVMFATATIGTALSNWKIDKTLWQGAFGITSLDIGGNKCAYSGPCSDDFLMELSQEFSETFNSQIFLTQSIDPNGSPSPSKVYKFEDFIKALDMLKKSGKVRRMLNFQCNFLFE